MPLAVLAIAVVLTALTTGVQFAWTDLALSSAVGATTRFASNVSYSGTSNVQRRGTADQVHQWQTDVASEAHVEPDDISVVAHSPGSTVEVPLEDLTVGDIVTLKVEKTISNPLYRVAAHVANAVTGVVSNDDVLDPDGIAVRATATNEVG